MSFPLTSRSGVQNSSDLTYNNFLNFLCYSHSSNRTEPLLVTLKTTITLPLLSTSSKNHAVSVFFNPHQLSQRLMLPPPMLPKGVRGYSNTMDRLNRKLLPLSQRRALRKAKLNATWDLQKWKNMSNWNLNSQRNQQSTRLKKERQQRKTTFTKKDLSRRI